MHSNRNTRNTQQLRSLIQNMGRSIDEARTKRLGPVVPESRPSAPARPDSGGQLPSPQPALDANEPAPPIRAANEMFVEGGQRLKARPKRSP